jgi:hypothetical protein
MHAKHLWIALSDKKPVDRAVIQRRAESTDDPLKRQDNR